jgi:hypothetical protein
VYDGEEGGPAREDDGTFVEACAVLEQFFEERPTHVFYDRQLCVQFEKRYFHWITSRALRHLVALKKVATDLEVIRDLRDEDGTQLTLRFYRNPKHRYWLRQRNEMAALVRTFAGELGRALGQYGELLCDAGLGGAGFARAATKVREWKGRRWEQTAHDLDRVYVRDGIEYGCEIKNTLKYLPVEERGVKIAMCKHLGLKPLFVVRWLPKDHIHKIVNAGGFAILFEHQLYPIGQEALAEQVGKELGLPVKCLTELPPDAVARFVRLHERECAKKPHE